MDESYTTKAGRLRSIMYIGMLSVKNFLTKLSHSCSWQERSQKFHQSLSLLPGQCVRISALWRWFIAGTKHASLLSTASSPKPIVVGAE